MLSENIRRFRKARPLRQEELAERVHVVRQTVSKWETGLSVPDAEQLRDLAAVLGVSVSALLDLTPEDSEADLAGELARRNEKLAELQRREALRRRVSGKPSAAGSAGSAAPSWPGLSQPCSAPCWRPMASRRRSS